MQIIRTKENVCIFTKNSWVAIRTISSLYQNDTGYDLKQTIVNKWKGSTAANGVSTILDVSRDLHKFFANQLRISMRGIGTKDELLQ